MEIEINVSDATPVYAQLVAQIIAGVLSGSLESGLSLPSIRQLADNLDLNHNTVAKAYKQLEAQRIIQTAGRKGTFIHPNALSNAANNNLHTAEFQLESLINSMSERGVHNSDLVSLLTDQINRIKG